MGRSSADIGGWLKAVARVRGERGTIVGHGRGDGGEGIDRDLTKDARGEDVSDKEAGVGEGAACSG